MHAAGDRGGAAVAVHERLPDGDRIVGGEAGNGEHGEEADRDR